MKIKSITRWGVRFETDYDEIIWSWPWRRTGDYKWTSLAFEGSFKTLEELKDCHKGYHIQSLVDNMNIHIALLRKLHPPIFKHNCIEWGEMEIDEYMPEILSCNCFKELRKIKGENRVKF